MDVFSLVVHLILVQTVNTLTVAISGQAYIEPGVPYNISCTVDEYRDNRQTTFSAKLSETNREEIIVWYYKPYGCFDLRDRNPTDCRNASCACDDDGLTTHWTYNTPSDLTTPVAFSCTSTNNDLTNIQSSDFVPTIPLGPGSSLKFNPSNTSVTKRKGEKLGPIECTATCNPPCRYIWTKPDRAVINDGELTIESMSTKDHGSFLCTASNGFGDSQNKILDVIVNYGPDEVILSPPTKQYTLAYGNTIPPINCTTNCRPECQYIWSGPNVPSDTVNILSLQNIQTNQSGDFNCTASNEVGSMQSFVINVNVQYEPFVNDLSINGTNFTVRENTTVILSCNFDGNPAPQNTWKKDNTILSETGNNNGRSFYKIDAVRCKDYGNYSCIANNSLGTASVNKSLLVTCSPRLNVEMVQQLTTIGLPKGATLTLTVHLISYPNPSSTVWVFKDNNGNETDIASKTNTYEWFKHVTVLKKTNLTQDDFGDYILKVQNILGSASQTYHVVPQGPPDPTTILNVTCGVNTAVLYWKTSFNGGETQNFSIIVCKNEKEIYIHDTSINDEDGEQIKFTSIQLSAGKYILKIYGKNSYGNQNSTNEMLCQVKDDDNSDSDPRLGAAAAGGTVAAMFIIVVIVLIVFVKRRRSLKRDDGRSNLTTEDKDDDGLKDNPLYVSSGETSSDNGPLYSVVIKTKIQSDVPYRTGNLDQGPVYSLVKNTDAKGITGKDMEMGSVKANSKNLVNTKDYAEVKGNTVKSATKDKTNQPSKNKDGLVYADLDIEPCVDGNKFIIRGIENRINYAIIDLTKTAEPLPSDDDEDEQNSNENIQDKS